MLEAKQQLRMILKGVMSCVSEEELLAKLEEDRPLTIKLGLDPSAPDIHLGHAVVLRKIRQMQDLGHRAVIVIGDFTGKIGDPTGKAKGRTALSDEQVRINAKTYCEQIFKVLNPEQTEIRFNGEWLEKLTMKDLIQLASHTTVARILERDDFQNRYRNQVPISLHEFFYPLMQAYDSIALNADMELGGSDQTFNILMGRTMQKGYGQKLQAALFMPILEGLDGTEKMSKSLGNYIGVSEPPEVMFKKVMEVPDSLIIKYFELATDEHPDTIEAILRELESGANPRDIKYRLAKIITCLYHGEAKMLEARTYFDAAYGKGAIPEKIPEFSLKQLENPSNLEAVIPALIERNYVSSKSEFYRLIRQKGVQINGKKAEERDLKHNLNTGDVLRIGKKKFLRFLE